MIAVLHGIVVAWGRVLSVDGRGMISWVPFGATHAVAIVIAKRCRSLSMDTVEVGAACFIGGEVFYGSQRW